jgi:misacylated tRNA(Ala) deacylase
MQTHATTRLYLEDDHCFEAEATVVAARESALAFDRTCFYPGGGGQPCDEGSVRVGSGEVLEIVSVHGDLDEILMRYHTVLHVLNTIALKDYGGWITGVQIGVDYSRIDFKVEGFSAAMRAELEKKVRTVLDGNHAVKSYYLPEEEFRRRDDLLRTLEAKPPVSGGQVRVVEIEGFDAQACGGTHVRNTAEVGTFSIFRTENKGKINKRLYVRLEPAAG